MTDYWTPEIETGEVIEKTVIQDHVANLPPNGTRIRATLGESVIVGTVRGIRDTRPDGWLFHVTIDGDGYDGFREMTIWYGVPWQIEILPATDEKPEEDG